MLEYSAPPAQPLSWWEIAFWLMPLWCGLLMVAAYSPPRFMPAAYMPSDYRNDIFWWVAIAIPFLAFLDCWGRRRRACAWYCLAVCLTVTAIGIAIPSLGPYLR